MVRPVHSGAALECVVVESFKAVAAESFKAVVAVTLCHGAVVTLCRGAEAEAEETFLPMTVASLCPGGVAASQGVAEDLPHEAVVILHHEVVETSHREGGVTSHREEGATSHLEAVGTSAPLMVVAMQEGRPAVTCLGDRPCVVGLP